MRADYYALNREKVKARTKAWAENNRERASALRTAYKRRKRAKDKAAREAARCDAHVLLWMAQPAPPMPVLHDAHVRLFKTKAVQFRRRYRNDPTFNLAERMRRQVRKKLCFDPNIAEILRGAMIAERKSNRVVTALGYSIAELRKHIERQFVKGMSWDNMGRKGWHVDHIHPKRCFPVETLEGMRAYWALPNLRPLWSGANLRKGAKIETLL